jgi:hypothetical protein
MGAGSFNPKYARAPAKPAPRRDLNDAELALMRAIFGEPVSTDLGKRYWRVKGHRCRSATVANPTSTEGAPSTTVD